MNNIEKYILDTLNKDYIEGLNEAQSLTDVELLRKFIEIKEKIGINDPFLLRELQNRKLINDGENLYEDLKERLRKLEKQEAKENI